MPEPIVVSISTHARALGERNKGVPKKITPEDRERRRRAMVEINRQKAQRKEKA